MKSSLALHRSTLFLLVAFPWMATAGTTANADHDLSFFWLENSAAFSDTDTDSVVEFDDGLSATTGGSAASLHGQNNILTRSTISSPGPDPLKIKVLSSLSFDLTGVDRSNTWFGVGAETENKVLHSEDVQFLNAPAGNDFRATVFWRLSGEFLFSASKPLDQDPLYSATALMSFGYESSASLYPSGGPAVGKEEFEYAAPGGVLTGTDPEHRSKINQLVEIDLITSGSANIAHVVELTSNTNLLNDGPSLNFDLSGIALHDFSATATLVGVLFRDLDGNVLDGIEVQSSLGYVYPVLSEAPTPVPLPGAWLLLVTTLPFVARRSSSSRRRAIQGPWIVLARGP